MILCLAIVGGIPAETMVTHSAFTAKQFEKHWLEEAGFLEVTDDMSSADITCAFIDAREEYRDIGHEDIDYYIYYGVEPDKAYY